MNIPTDGADLAAVRDSLERCSLDELRILLEARGLTTEEVDSMFPSREARISALLTVESDTGIATLTERETDDAG